MPKNTRKNEITQKDDDAVKNVVEGSALLLALNFYERSGGSRNINKERDFDAENTDPSESVYGKNIQTYIDVDLKKILVTKWKEQRFYHAIRYILRWLKKTGGKIGPDNLDVDDNKLRDMLISDSLVNDFLNKKHLSAILGRGFSGNIITNIGDIKLKYPEDYKIFQFGDARRRYGVTKRILEYFAKHSDAENYQIDTGDGKLSMYWQDSLNYFNESSDIFWSLHGFTLRSDVKVKVIDKGGHNYDVIIEYWKVTLKDKYDYQPPEDSEDYTQKYRIALRKFKHDLELHKKALTSLFHSTNMSRMSAPDRAAYIMTKGNIYPSIFINISNEAYIFWIRSSLLEDEKLATPFDIEFNWFHKPAATRYTDKGFPVFTITVKP